MRNFADFVKLLSKLLDRAAGFCIAGVMILVISNVILRAIFGQPILGTYELVGFLTALGIGLALAHCALQNGHISVGYVMDRLPSRLQAAVDLLTNSTALGFWGLTVWHLCQYAGSMAVSGVVSSTARVPVYPVIYLLALGFSVLCLALVVRVADSARIVFGAFFPTRFSRLPADPIKKAFR